MLTQKTKDEMYTILRPSLAQSENLNEKIDLFDKLISLAPTCPELSALDTTVYDALNNNFYKLDNFTVNEQIFKLILYIVNKEAYDYIISNHKGLASVYKNLNIMNASEISLMLNGADDDSDTPVYINSSITDTIENNFKNNKRLYPHVLGYIFRNNEAHIKSEQTLEVKMKYYTNILISCLNGAWEYRNEIMDAYAVNSVKFKEYIMNIIKNYEEKSHFKYIPSTVTPWHDSVKLSTTSTNIVDILNNNPSLRKIKLVGYAGAGKTTTLEYFEYQDALKCQKLSYKDNIPVLLSLINISGEIDTYNLDTIVEDQIMKKIGTEDKYIIDYLLNHKKINLYLDGLNEISVENKKPVFDAISKFVNKTLTKVIVSDRDSDSYSALNTIPTFILCTMNDSDIEEFIKGNSISPDTTLPKIMESVKNNKDIHDYISHPYLLKKLVSIVDDNKEIPEDIEQLTKIYIDSLIEREEISKCDPNAKYINRLLMFLAVSNNSDGVMSIFYILKRFKKCKELFDFNADSDVLLNLIVKMGLLKKVGNDQYAFAEENYSSHFFIEAYNAGLTDKDVEDDTNE